MNKNTTESTLSKKDLISEIESLKKVVDALCKDITDKAMRFAVTNKVDTGHGFFYTHRLNDFWSLFIEKEQEHSCGRLKREYFVVKLEQWDDDGDVKEPSFDFEDTTSVDYTELYSAIYYLVRRNIEKIVTYKSDSETK